VSEYPGPPVSHALEGSVVRVGPGPRSLRHAATLLGLLGATVEEAASGDSLAFGGVEVRCGPSAGAEDAEWARSGAMAVTGTALGPPLVAPGAPATAARGAALAIAALTAVDPSLVEVTVDGAQLLGERAALAGLARRGSVAPGGSARLVTAGDALVAVNLPRPSDLELVRAWLEVDAGSDPWPVVVEACAERPAVELVERAQLVGLTVALVPEPGALATDEQARHRGVVAGPRGGIGPVVRPWVVTGEHRDHRAGTGRSPRRGSEPGLVVDLSSMWAGPLCANLLGLAGFGVVKVESVTRPDGARHGPAAFFDLLHAGHRSVVVDFADAADRARLGALLATADVVVESSRPRALDQLGLGPGPILERSPSTVWVSITGYGRAGPWSNRVAFGDDAAAAAGMIGTAADAAPVFCGDALADPLTGVHAALAALALRHGGHGGLVDVALREVVASTLAGVPIRPAVSPAARRAGEAWLLDTAAGPVEVCDPVARPVRGPASALGIDTDQVLGTRPGS
jgi:crotonobetainyl-CoA:carnitine CoA-transferase CaiB-like acyl-CoA transferase